MAFVEPGPEHESKTEEKTRRGPEEQQLDRSSEHLTRLHFDDIPISPSQIIACSLRTYLITQ
jgi:hypothetical protein